MNGDIHEIESVVETQARSTRAIVIVDPASYELAAERLVDIKGVRKRVDEFFDPTIKSAFTAHRNAVAMKRQVTDRIDSVERDLKARMLLFQNEQRRIAAEKEAAARETLKKQAEESQLSAALDAEAEGDLAEAEAIMNEPVSAPVVIIQPDIPQTEGISVRKVWKFRIVNPAIIPLAFLTADEKKLGAYARAMKEEALVPGVEFYAEESVAVRS